MSSGQGILTKRGRCFDFWKDYIKCRTENDYPRIDCKNQVEDYLECLHHTKEVLYETDFQILTLLLIEAKIGRSNKRDEEK